MKFRPVTNAIAVCCLLLIAIGVSIGQSAKTKPNDLAMLRSQFIAAFGNDFDLVKDELKSRAVERGGGTYWLAFVRPRHTGYFYLQYRYRASEPLEIREHEVHLSVGAQRCRRGAPYGGVYGRFCLGDTVIVPVLVNKYAGHEFKLIKAEYTDEKDDPPESVADSPGLDKSTIINPASPTLRYVGRDSHKSLHRTQGYTLNLYAEFEAVRPGKLNLMVTGSREAGDLNVAGLAGIPIIVLPLGAPATLIAGREEVRGYRVGYDDREYLSSTSGNNYMTNVLILQPGDRISACYFSIVRRGDFASGHFNEASHDPSEDLKPVIKVRPFSADTRYDFTEWIVDHLPR